MEMAIPLANSSHHYKKIALYAVCLHILILLFPGDLKNFVLHNAVTLE